MTSPTDLSCFKTYDIRGKLGKEMNEEIAYRIGRGTAESLKAERVVVGFDARETSPKLAQAVSNGICEAGADVYDIGLVGTEETYAAVVELNASAGIEITASHNPIDYNGMKIVKQGSRPLSKNQFSQIKHLVEKGNFQPLPSNGVVIDVKDIAREAYLEKIMGFVDTEKLKPLKIVINCGNGAAGPTLCALNKKLLENSVKTDFVFVNLNPDSSFPNGIPNPLLKENRSSTSRVVIREKADFGVAFDGDFDRCFLFDHLGQFLPGEYVVGLLAKVFLKKEKYATIIHDPRVIWNTKDVVKKCGGNAVISKTGHAFVKAAMRDVEAIYGGEMSAHHYFRDFGYCDSGMIPWLLTWELLSQTSHRLNHLISQQKSSFPSSGEINFKVANSTICLQYVKEFYSADAHSIDDLDGLSMSFENWRFNLRQSNTEPLVRLNVETKGDELLLREKTEELESILLSI